MTHPSTPPSEGDLVRVPGGDLHEVMRVWHGHDTTLLGVAHVDTHHETTIDAADATPVETGGQS